MQNVEHDLTGVDLDASGQRYAIVVARFNQKITGKLLEGARRALFEHGVEESSVTVMWVPGAFELPLAAKKLAASGDYDGVICLGAVIRGETPHFDFVAGQAASGILNASLETEVPITFSVLTTENEAQAVARLGNGYSGALTAIEMANLLKKI